MDYIKSYLTARNFFLEKFVPEQKKVIQTLIDLRDEIQKETTLQKFGSVGYSSVGLISDGASFVSLFAAPMTAGLSTAISIARYGGMAFGFVDIAHRLYKMSMIMKLIKRAETKLQAHEITFSDFIRHFLRKLESDFEIIENKLKTIREIKCDEEQEISEIIKHWKEIGMLVAVPPNLKTFMNLFNESKELIVQLLVSDGLVCRGISIATKIIVQIGAKQVAVEIVKENAKDCSENILEKVTNHGAKQVTKEGLIVGTTDFATKSATDCTEQVTKEGIKEGATFAFNVATLGVGSVLDALSLINSVKDLSRFRKGELCAEAEKLNSVIKKMEIELEIIMQLFEEKSNDET
ncbi:uncharacterized protein LOC128184868 [Crassostrea angulata]|uniref:uncharacterized protein LOC128184868 n=1 Tax=Magallana angulata TaxID=2784310 RepID=UPI0022B08424|nr:uncharacterized protein LOC128184868 [Crassostrea angulata]XP_052710461.1 uncharacterized protein LOC128184868 [Crassostrea angulata]